ncbi:MAG: hypothetical protein K6U89_13535 [Chloroflexi bacterium]|nr:hypothetical protein [Chloroflexota bacterium]
MTTHEEGFLRRWLAAADELREKLYVYAVDDEPGRFQADRAAAWQQFFGPLVPPGQLPDDHPDWDAFDDWFIFDYRLAGSGQTPLELFVHEEGEHLPPLERDLATRWQQDRLGVFAVKALGGGEGALLRDLSDAALLRVPNVPLSRHGARWDLLIGRLVPVGPVWGFTAPPRHLLPALLDRLPTDYTGHEPPRGDRRGRAVEFWRVVRQLAAEQPAVALTDEGDPVRPSRARYRVAAPAAVAAALQAQRFLEPVAETPAGERWLVWRGLPLGMSTREGARAVELAVVRLAGDEVTVECLSPQRLARARARLEPYLGTFTLLEEQTTPLAATPRAEDLARQRAAGLIVGGVLQAVAADRRLDALNHAVPRSEAAVLLEHFDREPFAYLAGLHHRGQIGLNNVWLRGEVAGVELVYELSGHPPCFVQARLRDHPTGWRLEAIRPGRLGQPPAEALWSEELRALWSGDWQWVPVGSVGNHPVLGIALKRLHLAKYAILFQVMAVRLWEDFVARALPDPNWDAERWARALEAVVAWQSGRAPVPEDPPAARLREALGLASHDRRYAIDLPVLEAD